ncbi:hypothetical protein ACQU6J_003511 [Escherichia coli]|uniref:hypothetical protein n=1 Tax=Escherichia coli TaxID=562 RepID=UPI000BE511D9|nr:hypothetical protein [Escherichia coli]HAH3691796.1 hypothetical protein [Escherichia coli]
MNYPMDSLTPFHNALLSNTLWLTSKNGFPLPAGNHLPRCFRLSWSGYSSLVISKIIDINSGKLIVHNLVMNITLIFP